jgi:hypothetical protein
MGLAWRRPWARSTSGDSGGGAVAGTHETESSRATRSDRRGILLLSLKLCPDPAVRISMARVLVLMVCVVGCASPEWPRRVSVDEGTSVAFQVALTQATARWNALAQDELGQDVFTPGGGDVVVHPYLRRPHGGSGECALACTELAGSDVWATPSAGDDLEALLTHELGHILGLDDSESPGVMRQYGWRDGEFSAQDRRALWAAALAHPLSH